MHGARIRSERRVYNFHVRIRPNLLIDSRIELRAALRQMMPGNRAWLADVPPMNVAFEPKRLEKSTAAAVAVVVHDGPRDGGARVGSIDLLRGFVMIVMALDHTRDFFSAGGFNPRDVSEPALFLTRWVTHFCAPTFVFLAGVSAYLYAAKGRTRAETSRYLLSRGLWLVLIEFTLVRLGWTFSLRFDHLVVQVIFAIGASMIALSALIHFPRWAIAAIGFAVISGHDAFDGIRAEQLGSAAPLWHFLHQPGFVDGKSGLPIFVLYPLIPWVGVMAVGFALGPIFTLQRAARTRELFAFGVATIAGFILLRATNLYGDPLPWAEQDTLLASVLSFINCEKYPPSLLYLGMTLGPALVLAALLEKVRDPLANRVATFGRVPFFFYVVHIFLIHALAVLFALAATGDAGWLFGPPAAHRPDGYGLSLPGIYAVWLAVVVSLYPLCRWFDALKRQRSEWWWSYL